MTITKRKRADGTTAYRAEVRIKKSGKIIHQESQTFDQRRLAEAWRKQRELALQKPGALEKVKASGSIKDLIKWYITEYGNAFGRTKREDLTRMQGYAISEKSALHVGAQDFIEHVKARRLAGAGASTAGNDLIWFRTVFKAARPALQIDLNLYAVDDAAAFCRAQRLIGKSRRRERRPTLDELQKLEGYFSRRDGRADIPMAPIMWFAVWSARRQSEITRLLWADNDERDHTGLVRDAKHPRAKEGNHRRFKYTPEAWEIISWQPKTDERIFPYAPKSISAAFTRACHMLGIIDLEFHDLRHEGVSRLFERGYSIQEVQQFSLHESWATLQRYTHLRPGNVKHR